MSDAGNSTNTWGWHFRGQQLVFGLIRQLIAHHGLSSTSTIIFSGGSAGARGVMVLIDLLVKEHFPPGAKVMYTNHTPYLPTPLLLSLSLSACCLSVVCDVINLS